MAIELFFSNQIESLALRLSEYLSAELVERKNKFEPSVVIVPNQNMIKWLQLQLARLQGIVLNLACDYLESGVWQLLTAMAPAPVPWRLLDQSNRTLELIKLLQKIDLTISPLAPLAGYLLESNGRRRIDFARRVWQLAEKLSSLFQEYEYHRDDMIASWQLGHTTASSMERCQQYLYQKLYQPSSRQGRPYSCISLFSLGNKVLGSTAALKKIPVRTIHIFGMSQIPKSYLALLGRLAEFHSIYIYTLNPSQEFWEDIQTPGERRWLRKKKVGGSIQRQNGDLSDSETSLQDHPLLALWGKPGRDNVRRLCELTDYAFDDCYCREPSSGTVLHQLQQELLTLTKGEAKPVKQDCSLQIFACPSRFREVETVYNTICYNLLKDATLKLTDMAVLVTDMNLYKPIFDAVFNRYPRMLTYNLVDSNAHMESLYGQAVIQILDLAQGTFTRKAVFELLLNPCCMQRWNISVEEISDWVNWTDALNVFHDYSRKEGDLQQSVKERFSWKQAMQRLRLGRIMSPPPTLISHKRDFGGMIPFADLASTDMTVLEKFCIVIETLFTQVRQLSRFQGHAAQWGDLFASVCDQLIAVPEAHRGEAAVSHAVLKGLADLKEALPEAEDRLATTDQEIWDIELFQEYIRFILKGIAGGRGDYLTSGVTVSALNPMRPIPFKIIFILGLEEGRFPGRETFSGLDLRQSSPRREDTTLPERNCYLFLEMLLSVRQKLYLGYVSRDLQKDRSMQPCSVINQLKEHLTAAILADGEEFKITQIPLKGNHLSYLDWNSITGWSDVLSNFSLADHLALLRSDNRWTEFLEGATDDEMTRISPLTPELNTSLRPTKGSQVLKLMVTAHQLARFLKDPVRHSARIHLGFFDPSAGIEELAMKEDEPFFSVFPIDYNIYTETLRLWLDQNFNPADNSAASQDALAEVAVQIYAAYENKSAVPEGIFAQMDRQAIIEALVSANTAMAGLLDEIRIAPKRYRAIFCGFSPDHGAEYCQSEPILQLAPVEIASAGGAPHGGQQKIMAEISAALNWLWQDSDGQWHAIVLTGAKNPGRGLSRHLLDPLIAYLTLQCSERCPNDLKLAALQFHLVFGTKILSYRCALHPPQAESILKNLLEDYGNQFEFHWLPFEKVSVCKTGPLSLSPENVSAEAKQEFSDEMAGFFEEETDYLLHRLAQPMTPAMYDIAAKRFGWLAECVSEGE